ncbi:hypothetical protein [Rhodoblastus sp.]|uniref:hypothetical protein n=1 Tax=Rhodoblastus sp. TaxID=1962975 RepID=UPI003F9CE8A3
MAQSDECVVERAAREVKRQQSSFAVLFDDVSVQKGQKTRRVFGRVAKTQAIAGIHPFRRMNARAPCVFANFRDKSHFHSDRSFVPDPNAGEATGGCHMPAPY